MKRAILWVALAAAALAGSDAAAAQTAAEPATEATAPLPDAAAPPADAAAPPAGAASGPIAALQQQLKEEGLAPGPVNGVMTEATRRALGASRRRAGQRRSGGVPDATAAAGSAAADPVRRAQAGLQQLGLFAGPVDGVVGAQTRDAIIRFEAARHLTVDPRVSDRLLAALEAAGANPAPPRRRRPVRHRKPRRRPPRRRRLPKRRPRPPRKQPAGARCRPGSTRRRSARLKPAYSQGSGRWG